MQSPPADSPPDDGPGKTRLDRELDEILSKNENIRLLPPPPKPSRPRAVPLGPKPSVAGMVPQRFHGLLTAPIVVALGLAVVALLLADLSPLLANLLGLAAVVCIIHPMFQRFRRPATPPETRMWRGREIDVPPQREPSPLDGVRDWWKSLKR